MASNEMVNISKTVCSEMKVDGFHLIERREETLVNHMTIVIHSRSIDGRSYAVTRTLTEDKDVVKIVTETEMTHDGVELFEEYWSNLWNPYLAVTYRDSSSILRIKK